MVSGFGMGGRYLGNKRSLRFGRDDGVAALNDYLTFCMELVRANGGIRSAQGAAAS